MARVTVEDCVDKVDSWFELVMLTAHRSRAIANGAPLTVSKDNDKPSVVALREVAAGTITPEELRESLVRSMQKVVESERVDEAIQSFMNEETSYEKDKFQDANMRFENETFYPSDTKKTHALKLDDDGMEIQ